MNSTANATLGAPFMVPQVYKSNTQLLFGLTPPPSMSNTNIFGASKCSTIMFTACH